MICGQHLLHYAVYKVHEDLCLLLQVIMLSSQEHTQLSFNSLPGQGVIFSVVVRDPVFNTSAAYVPAHTYACSFNSTLDNCRTLGELLDCYSRYFPVILFKYALIIMLCFSRESFHKGLFYCDGGSWTICVFFGPSFLQMW